MHALFVCFNEKHLSGDFVVMAAKALNTFHEGLLAMDADHVSNSHAFPALPFTYVLLIVVLLCAAVGHHMDQSVDPAGRHTHK